MQVIIWDHFAAKEYANWSRGEYNGLTFTKEIPGGWVSASFNVPVKYSLPYAWADVWNHVDIYHGSTLGWSGFIYAIERYWGENNSGIKIDCVGDVARLNWAYTNVPLSNEKASAYIAAHIMLNSQIFYYISTGKIHTADYTIPGVIEAGACATLRDMLDRAWGYNANAYIWYISHAAFYWVPAETTVSYTTTTEFSTGSLRQEMSDEFANGIAYTYRDLAGVDTLATLTNSTSGYPIKYRRESYENNMTAAQALQRATENLENSKVLGATGSIKVARVWDSRGMEIHPSELEPGKIIRIEGLVPAKASPSMAFVANDIDVFPIASVTYNDDDQSADISPGRLPYTLPNVVRAR